MWDQRCNRSANPVAINDGNFMKRMICGVIVSCLLASGALAQTRYFLFPSEVPAFTVQYARMVNVFGIAHSVQTSDAYGIQFSLSDKSESTPYRRRSKSEAPLLFRANLMVSVSRLPPY
jgi:cytochrome c-type biogenesis protein CcmE